MKAGDAAAGGRGRVGHDGGLRGGCDVASNHTQRNPCRAHQKLPPHDNTLGLASSGERVSWPRQIPTQPAPPPGQWRRHHRAGFELVRWSARAHAREVRARPGSSGCPSCSRSWNRRNPSQNASTCFPVAGIDDHANNLAVALRPFCAPPHSAQWSCPGELAAPGAAPGRSAPGAHPPRQLRAARSRMVAAAMLGRSSNCLHIIGPTPRPRRIGVSLMRRCSACRAW